MPAPTLHRPRALVLFINWKVPAKWLTTSFVTCPQSVFACTWRATACARQHAVMTSPRDSQWVRAAVVVTDPLEAAAPVLDSLRSVQCATAPNSNTKSRNRPRVVYSTVIRCRCPLLVLRVPAIFALRLYTPWVAVESVLGLFRQWFMTSQGCFKYGTGCHEHLWRAGDATRATDAFSSTVIIILSWIVVAIASQPCYGWRQPYASTFTD